jgi:exosortase/archaeosortase
MKKLLFYVLFLLTSSGIWLFTMYMRKHGIRIIPFLSIDQHYGVAVGLLTLIFFLIVAKQSLRKSIIFSLISLGTSCIILMGYTYLAFAICEEFRFCGTLDLFNKKDYSLIYLAGSAILVFQLCLILTWEIFTRQHRRSIH